MLSKIQKKGNYTFVKNVIILASGTAGAQFIGMLASPLITRFYGPEAYGLMGSFLALANIIIPVSALTYPIAIVLPREKKEAEELIHLSIFVSIILSMFTFLIIFLFNNQIINLLNLNEIGNLIFLIPLIILFAGFMQVSRQWLIRTKQFKINAKADFLQSVIVNGGKVGFGFLMPVSTVLILLSTSINAIRAYIMWFSAEIPKLNLRYYLQYGKNNMKKLAKKYYDFPMYRAPESLITGISHSLPILMLSAFFGPASAGFYSIGRTVLSLPSQLIGESVGDVFFPKVTELYNNNNKITPIIRKSTFALMGIGIIPYGIIFLFGPFLFSLVFGSEWSMAGEYARWIALWSFTNFFNKPSVKTLAVINAQKYHLLYTIFGIIVRLLALIVGFTFFKSDIYAVMLFGIAGAVLNLGLISMTYYLSIKKQEKM